MESSVSTVPRRHVRRWPLIVLGLALSGLALYLLFVFSSIPAISTIRVLYIETAMSTMSHQWLATSFIPGYIINDVMADVERQFDENLVEASEAIRIPLPVRDPHLIPLPEESLDPEEAAALHREYMILTLTALFPELDVDTIPDDILGMEFDTLQLQAITDFGINTIQGDVVWAIDVPNKILICEVKGDGYVGKLAFVKDSSRVGLVCNTNTRRGSTVTELCCANDAVLGINASGFYDPNGQGNGLSGSGLVRSNSKTVIERIQDKRYQIAGYDENDDLFVGYGLDVDSLRDAMQFYPVLVLNGKKHVDGTYGLGIHPRSAIGQTVDKTTLMLIIDGRQMGYSIGTTVGECADILLRYGCWTAMNMDGGSSASMTYLGKMITRTSSPDKEGRWLPDAWVVFPPA